jgi:pantoate--beta-alanine ligase
MRIARTLEELAAHRAALAASGGGLALVPTMGALHAGHVSLVTIGRREAGAVAASIFVNPLQFAPGEDLARYPRDEAGDLAALAAAGCDLAWLPEVETMYPPGDATVVEVAGPALGYEGDARPTHFRGVATVVARLFGQVRPDVAVFGEKDWQQLQVVRRMVADLALGVRIVAGPVVREADGLALSSRNRYLDAAARARAVVLPRTLDATARALRAGDAVAPALAAALAALREAGFAPDYLDLIDGAAMRAIDEVRPGARLIAAARIGGVRLLDTLEV